MGIFNKFEFFQGQHPLSRSEHALEIFLNIVVLFDKLQKFDVSWIPLQEDEMKWLEISDVLCILCMHKVCHCITCIGIRFKSWELLSNTWTLLSSFHSVFIPSHRRLHGYKVLNTNHKFNSRVTMLFKKEYKLKYHICVHYVWTR